MSGTPGRALRRRIDHPVVDLDGHLIESAPLLLGYVEQIGGIDAVEDLVASLQRDPPMTMGNGESGESRGPWWGVTNDARDLAAVMAPAILADRLDDLGIDFTVLYPTLGLGLVTIPDAELRRLACRALNTMNAELTAPHARCMTAAAVIPMHTPDEAMDELDHCATNLGFKAAMIPTGVARPLDAYPEAFPAACAIDRFGIDAAHDYDPVWQSFVDHQFAVTSHAGIGLHYLPPATRSPSNYVINHLLGHAFHQLELAKSLVMGGVPMRFPTLRFAFLEGGAGWAIDLLGSLREHWGKRGGDGMARLDPSRLDRGALRDHLAPYGLSTSRDPGGMSGLDAGPWVRNEFDDSEVVDPAEFVEMFEHRIFLGCEGDDSSVVRAFDQVRNPGAARLQPAYASDIGHWDVVDLDSVLESSFELVDEGLITAEDYAEFVFTNPVKVHAEMNPAFFNGTAVESAVRRII